MKKQQLILAGAGILVLASLLIFGKTVANKIDVPLPENGIALTSPARFNIENYLQLSKQKLSVSQQNYVSALENSVKRGDVKDQQIKTYRAMALFWKDTAHQADLYNFYIAQAAKLENSEKNLTFAAQLILKDLRGEEDVAKRGWKAEQAISLFEQAIVLNPANDSLKVGLGSVLCIWKRDGG